MATEDEEFEFRLRAEREAASQPAQSAPARQPVADIPGTPAGYAERVAMIPGAAPGTVAPQAQRPAPVPQEERGLFSRIRAGVEAARNTIASIVPGGVGFGLGAAEGMLRNIASGKFGTQEGAALVEQTAANRAQQFIEATVTKPPSALGQEYARDVGEFAQRHGASVLAGPLGMTGTGRHTENLRNARQGLKAAMATTEAPPGLPPVAGEAPAGGLAKRVVQPNPALLEDVKSAEKAGLTVLPHHVAEGDAVRALGTAAGGAAYKQNTKAFTKALIKELDPEEKSVRLDTKTFHRVLDKQGKTIGESMAKYDMPVDDALRARLEAISKDAADNADADTGRMTMNRVREILGKAEAGEGQITGQAVRELDTAIGRQIRSNTKNQDLVARLRSVQDVLRDTAERQMAPDEAKAVQQARRRYAYAMEILPDIDDFGRTGYYEPGQLWKRLTGSEAGRQRVASERGGLTDLAKAGALVADRSGTGHGYVSVGSNSVGVGTSGMRAYASPNMMLKLVTGGAAGEKAYNRFGPNLVKRLAAEHDAELARAARKPEPPPLELAAPDAPTPQGPRPDVRGEAPAEVPEWTTAAGVDAQKPGSQIPAIEPDGLLPAVGDDMPPARINPEPRGRVPDIPAVPGRPDMPDVMVAGGPSEVAATEAAGRAMQAPDATLAREQQGFAPKKPEPPTGGGGTPPIDPRLAKIAELRQQAPSAAVKKVLDAREAEVKKAIKRETDISELEAAAQATDDVDLRQSLLAEANKLRGGKLPVGEATEGMPDLPKPKTEKIPVGKVIEGQPDLPVDKTERIPVGQATEIIPEVVEPVPERIPVGEATEMPERLPVGEVVEDPTPVGEAMEFEQLPVGEATEITPDVVEPARGPVVPEATNVDNAPTAPAGGGRSEGMEQMKAPPKPEDFANGAEYHLAVREWRSKYGAKAQEPSARATLVMDLDRKITNAERRLADRRKARAGLTPPAIVAEAIANIEKELADLRKQRQAAAQQENTRAPQEVTHAGMEIQEIPGQGGEPTRWQVTVPETGERVSTPSGLDAAKRIAENERKVIERSGTLAQRMKAAEEASAAEERARDEAKKARSAATAGKSLAEIKAMDHMNRTIRVGGKDMKAHEFVDARLAAGDAPKMALVDRVAPMSRAAFNRASNAEQRAHEAKVKAGGKKETYWLGGYGLSKTEYDYAVKKAAAQQESTRPEPQPAPTTPAGVGQTKEFLAYIDEDVARAPSAIDRTRRISNHILFLEAKLNDMKFNKKLKDSAGITAYDVTVKLRELKAAESALFKEMRASAAQQENTRAPQEVAQQAAEPQGRTGGREAAEAGAGDRVQRAAESGGQAEGAKESWKRMSATEYRLSDPTGGGDFQIVKKGSNWVNPDTGEKWPTLDGAMRGVRRQIAQEAKTRADEAASRAEVGPEPVKAAPAAKPAPHTETPATKPTGKALSPADVKAEFQRQVAAVPRFDDGGPETITLKAGGSTAKIQNTARRVAEYMKSLDTAKGGKTPKPASEKKAGIEGTKVSVPADKRVVGSKATLRADAATWGDELSKRAPITTIKDMIDDLDAQAAVDFAAAQGIDLEVVLKDDRKRLDRVRGLKPTPDTP